MKTTLEAGTTLATILAATGGAFLLALFAASGVALAAMGLACW